MSYWSQSMSKLHHFTSWFNPVLCLWILYCMSWLSRLCVKCILFHVFVLCNSVRITVHISICFCPEQLCTNYCFIPNFFPMRFCKMGILSCFLDFFARTNRWGRAPWCLSSQLWGLMPLWVLIFWDHHLRNSR